MHISIFSRQVKTAPLRRCKIDCLDSHAEWIYMNSRVLIVYVVAEEFTDFDPTWEGDGDNIAQVEAGISLEFGECHKSMTRTAFKGDNEGAPGINRAPFRYPNQSSIITSSYKELIGLCPSQWKTGWRQPSLLIKYENYKMPQRRRPLMSTLAGHSLVNLTQSDQSLTSNQ